MLLGDALEVLEFEVERTVIEADVVDAIKAELARVTAERDRLKSIATWYFGAFYKSDYAACSKAIDELHDVVRFAAERRGEGEA